MKARRALLTLLALSFATAAGAAQVNLRWDACWGAGGAMNRSFACDRNAGAHVLVGSFIPPTHLSDIVGTEFGLELAVAGGTLAPWWHFRNAGACRQTAMSINFVESPLTPSCLDWSESDAIGGITAYTPGAPIGNGATLAGTSVLRSHPPKFLLAGQEYLLFNIVLTNQKTVGTGACDGCPLGGCIAMRNIRLLTPDPDVSYYLFTNNRTAEIYDALATWQGGAGVVTYSPTGNLRCYAVSPLRTSTWGSVKALYR